MSYSQRILLSYLGFGVLMGIAFPFYVVFFVDIKPDMAIYFKLSTILAGLVMGVMNYLIYRFVIGKVLKKLSATFDQVSQGNLKVECTIRSNDDIGQLSLAINRMVGNLRKLIGKDLVNQLNEIAKQVAAYAKLLSKDAEEVTKATNHVSKMFHEVTIGAEEQLQMAEESSEVMHQLSQYIEAIAHKTKTVTDLSKKTAAGANEGNNQILKAVNQILLINESVKNSSDVTQLLGDSIKEISDIITVITNISTETNLLALNATIEAARAGEHGKGFAVVADHVRALAEQSKESAIKILKLIKEIQEYRDQTMSSMSDVTKEVKEGLKIIHVAGKSFKEIVFDTSKVAEEIQEIFYLSDTMSSNSEEIAASIDEMTTIARKSAANAQQVTASSEEQLVSMKEIAHSSDRLSLMSEELRQYVGKFNV